MMITMMKTAAAEMMMMMMTTTTKWMYLASTEHLVQAQQLRSHNAIPGKEYRYSSFPKY
jgi:hypothetical protein